MGLPRVGVCVVVVALVGFARIALAQTAPTGGAVALPAGADMRAPIPAGERMRVSSGYGPSAGSSLHDGTVRTCCANDFYALDLVYADATDGGHGRPILAPLRGEVVLSGWSSEGWANYGQRVVLRHDLGDGQTYHTMYAHLDSIDDGATVGAVIERGAPIGTLGRSCMGALSCGSFSGAHLHFAMHQGASIGGSGTGGSYGGRAVVPEPFDEMLDLVRGTEITSTNGGGPPPPPPPACASIPSAGRIVDESERCFTRGGSPAYWHSESAGYGGSLIWTYATSDATADNHGIWSLVFEAAGVYVLEAHTPAPFGQSRRAAYRVEHDGATDVATIDQSAVDGWNELGAYPFASGEQRVRLDDNTGEPVGDRRQLVFDAIRVTPVDAPPPPPPMDAGPPPRDGGSAMPDATPSTDEDAGRDPPDANDPGSADARAPLPDAARGDAMGSASAAPVTSGCGCHVASRATPSVTGAGALLALLTLVTSRRRRRPHGAQ